MYAPAALYRLRDRLALTHPELTALLTVASLFAGGLVVQHLPEPPTALAPTVIQYQQAFAVAAVQTEEAVAPAVDSVRAEVRATTPARRGAAKATPQRPVAINTATAAQLETLPRVGPKMAERILEYREARGGFRRVEDLRNVRGIGEKTLEQLRPLVTLD